MSNPLIPAPARFYAGQVVEVNPEEMEPFYERDSIIRQHRETVERLKEAKAEHDAKQDATIKEMEAIVTESLRIMGMMRQKARAARNRITASIDRKKNAAHNHHIQRHERAIELRKIEINRREAGKTARAMTNDIYKRITTKAAKNQSRTLARPNIPEE